MSSDEPSGIGGWLILPTLGLILTPFRIGFILLTTFFPLFLDGTWEALTTPGSEYYHLLWAPLLSFEILFNIFFIFASCTLLVLLFQKHYLFPILIITFYALNLAFAGLDFVALNAIPGAAAEADSTAMQQIVRAAGTCAIWILYFMNSERVRNTFTRA